jgi:N-acetylglutamate synthase-like GNAT family acetyltransferase
MKPLIRPASVGDQHAIVALVKSERLNPTNLDWRRFTVADLDGALVGAVQIRAHREGGRELGSLVVSQAHRREGLARKLIDAVLQDMTTEVWMITGRPHVPHYAHWGFLPAEAYAAPRGVRLNYRLGRAARILSWWRGLKPTNLTLLRRKANGWP